MRKSNRQNRQWCRLIHLRRIESSHTYLKREGDGLVAGSGDQQTDILRLNSDYQACLYTSGLSEYKSYVDTYGIEQVFIDVFTNYYWLCYLLLASNSCFLDLISFVPYHHRLTQHDSTALNITVSHCLTDPLLSLQLRSFLVYVVGPEYMRIRCLHKAPLTVPP